MSTVHTEENSLPNPPSQPCLLFLTRNPLRQSYNPSHLLLLPTHHFNLLSQFYRRPPTQQFLPFCMSNKDLYLGRRRRRRVISILECIALNLKSFTHASDIVTTSILINCMIFKEVTPIRIT